MQDRKDLIVGLGEVGKALKEVLSERYEVDGLDKENTKLKDGYDVIHICIPYTIDFVDEVLKYQLLYLKLNGLTIIHSTVPIGTSKKLGAVHSPIRGIHPNLKQGIKTFTKYFGGERAGEAAELFKDLVSEYVTTKDSDSIEAL